MALPHPNALFAFQDCSQNIGQHLDATQRFEDLLLHMRLDRRIKYTIGEHHDLDTRYCSLAVSVCTLFHEGAEASAYQRHLDKLRDIQTRTKPQGGILGNIASVIVPLAVTAGPQRLALVSYPHVRAIVEDHDPGNRWVDARTIRPCIDIEPGQYDDTQKT
jgi:hypothetical protein